MFGQSQIHRAYFTIGTNHYAFMVPSGFQMNASDPEKIVLSDADYTCFISIRNAGRLPAEAQDSPENYFRNLATVRFPNGTISDEISEFAANHGGPGFDLQWTNSSGAAQAARIAFIPTATSVLEFSVLCTSNKFNDGQLYLKVLLASFRSDEGGKLEINHLPDNS